MDQLNIIQTTTSSNEYVYTCISCRFQFETFEEQREHFKSELHRFNLKRKVFDLPPVTKAVFDSKIEAMKKEEEKSQKQSQTEPAKLECRICDKQFSSQGPYQQHLISKKHKANVAAGVPEKIRKTKPETEIVENKEEEEEPKELTLEEVEKLMEEKIKNAPKSPLELCLFCNHLSNTVDECIQHMSKDHSFFIPDIEFLHDLPGFLRYCADKISIGNICLYCNGKGKTFKDRNSTQAHMRDMSHCKLNYETEENEEEYDEFYDFSSQYQEGQVNPDGTPNELMLPPKPDILYNGHQIVFPDGMTVGHRDYAIYYKQRYVQRDERMEKIRNIVSQYRLLGYVEKPKSQYEIDRKAQRREINVSIKVGMKKNTQRYYKNQLLVQ